MMESLKANVEASQVVTKALVDHVSALVAEDNSIITRNMEGSMRFSIMTKPESLDQRVVQRLRYILPWFGQ